MQQTNRLNVAHSAGRPTASPRFGHMTAEQFKPGAVIQAKDHDRQMYLVLSPLFSVEGANPNQTLQADLLFVDSLAQAQGQYRAYRNSTAALPMPGQIPWLIDFNNGVASYDLIKQL
jgi:hypothetical protein